MTIEGFAEDWSVRGIVKAAVEALDDPSIDAQEQQSLRSRIRSLFCDCQAVDALNQSEVFALSLSLLETGFSIGMAASRTQAAADAAKYIKSAAGRASGQSRAAAAAIWKEHATVVACDLRSGNGGGFSQEELATEVIASWRLKEPDAPSFSSILKHVKEIEQIGKLPRRKSKPSKKAS